MITLMIFLFVYPSLFNKNIVIIPHFFSVTSAIVKTAYLLYNASVKSLLFYSVKEGHEL